MKRLPIAAIAAAMLTGILAILPSGSGRADDAASPIFGVTIPAGYRQWQLIAPSHVPSFDELRGILGNAVGRGTRIGPARCPSPTAPSSPSSPGRTCHRPSSKAPSSPAPRPRCNSWSRIQEKYASTGGWGFGKFIDGKPVDEAEHKACFACHEAHVKNHDYVFTWFAP